MRLLLASILVVLVGSITFAQTIPADLKKAMDARIAAQVAGDEQTWASYTTDDFLVIGPEGTVATKAERMAAIKGNKITNPPPKISEQQYRMYGDTVITTTLQESTAGPVRFATVWVKQNGQWRVASVQQTRVTKKP